MIDFCFESTTFLFCADYYWFGSGWGTRDFSSMSDLKEPTKGYLLNDTLVVEVKINVISTLKAIV